MPNKKATMGYCFEEAAFEADDFHAATFLEECQSRSPIVQVHHDLEKLMQSLENQHTLVQKAEVHVAELTELQTQKANLQLSITIAEKFHAVESLLGITPAGDTTSDACAAASAIFISAEQSIRLERSARLVLELGSLLAQGLDIPAILAEFATEIVPDSFYAREHTINTANVSHLLRAYVLLEDASTAESMVARLVMQPFLDDTMTRGRLDGKHRGSCEGLSGMYASVLTFVERTLGGVLALAVCQGGDATNSVDLLGQSVWTPVLDTMRSKLGEVFTPANPDRFHHVRPSIPNFTTSMSFVASLEQLCLSPGAALRFRSTHVQPFRDSWNLVVYMQLRQNELNQVLAASKATPRPMDSTFAFPVTTATWHVLVKTWADGVVLAPLVAASARYSLTVLSQYMAYWRDPLESAVALVANASKTAATLFADVHHPGLTSCDDVYCLGSDLHRLGMHHVVELARMERSCWDTAAVLVSDECKKVLPAVRTIKGQYQMTNKPMPTTPSTYVATVTRPLDEFLAKWREDVGTHPLASDVLSTTMDSYASAALDLLKSATELEESLKSRKNQRLMMKTPPFGGLVENIVPIRPPLSTLYEVHYDSSFKGATPTDLMEGLIEQAKRGKVFNVATVIDASGNGVYYHERGEWNDWDVEYVKIPADTDNDAVHDAASATEIVPSKSFVTKFLQSVQQHFAGDRCDENIAVFGARGYNTSAFLIVCYLVELKGLSLNDALEAYKKTNPVGIYSTACLEVLYKRYYSTLKPQGLRIRRPDPPSWDPVAADDSPEAIGADILTDDDKAQPFVRSQSAAIAPPKPAASYPPPPSSMPSTASHHHPSYKPAAPPVFHMPPSVAKKPLTKKRKIRTWEDDVEPFPFGDAVPVDSAEHERLVAVVAELTGGLSDGFPGCEHENTDKTLVDGVLVQDRDGGAVVRRFLAFDLIAWEGTSVYKSKLEKRLQCLQNEIILPRKTDKTLECADESFRVRMKDHFRLDKTEHLLRNFIPKVTHDVEGLIFTPKQATYGVGGFEADEPVFKFVTDASMMMGGLDGSLTEGQLLQYIQHIPK
ncbi:hypothetical protein DYB37_001299 [Aphanomyces astaci]|uniref:Conserved oligomeric Golgi complex subunit 2 n=2 Tax=Aphanomyces astaci TaxID=112090 RepID=A0A418E8K9_APHAT|nr:hypothetical protein DYB37_001299 [Aphanomyces astaci]